VQLADLAHRASRHALEAALVDALLHPPHDSQVVLQQRPERFGHVEAHRVRGLGGVRDRDLHRDQRRRGCA
jgi:hypothetical protein